MSYDEIIRREDLHKVINTFNLGFMKESLSIGSTSDLRDKYTKLTESAFHLKPPVGESVVH